VKRLLGLLSLVAFVLVFGPSPAQAANVWAATLYQLDGSGISAAATLAEQSDGTVQVVLTASGLKAGVQYISGVYNRSSIACRGGLIRAATTSGFSDTYTSREGGVTFTAQGPLSNVFSISVRETTEGRAPGTERACAERFPASLRATVQQEGSTATITLRLFNLSRETLALADIRGPIPAGMSLVTSSPTAQLVGNEARWLHISDMGPGQTRTFTYRLNTDGLANLIHGRDVTPDFEDSIDAISISLNAQNEDVYNRHCRPPMPGAFEALQDFAARAREFVPSVTLTAIDGLPGVDISACRAIAERLGVGFRRRELGKVG